MQTCDRRQMETNEKTREVIVLPYMEVELMLKLHMGPNNLCYITCHFLFFPYVVIDFL